MGDSDIITTTTTTTTTRLNNSLLVYTRVSDCTVTLQEVRPVAGWVVQQPQLVTAVSNKDARASVNTPL